MKQIFTIVFLCSFLSMSFAQQPTLEWVKGMGGSLSEDVGRSIGVDANGNVYTTGNFRATVDFDPSAGVDSKTAVGDKDVFIQKLAADGSFVWAKQMGGTGEDIAYGLEIDALGNVYTIGLFEDTVDFDPNAGVQALISGVGRNVFIQKLDPNGNFLWVKQIGVTGRCVAYASATDAQGNLYLTGDFSGTVDFDPSMNNQSLTSNGGVDGYVLKLDANGNFVWVKQVGSVGGDGGRGIATDANGNIYTTGYFRNTVDFDPNAATFNLTSAGDTDIFIQKLDANGNFVWAKRMGANSDEMGNAIVIDQSNNVYTTGYYKRNVDFDPGAGTFTLTASISQQANVFVQKLDANGNFIWARQLGDTGEDIAFALAVDQQNNIYTTGHFEGTVDFDPNAGTTNLTSNGVEDIFIQKLDSNSNLIWVQHFGGTSSDYSNALALDANNNLHTTGFFKLTVDFDPSSTATQNLTAVGSDDIYVLKLKQPCSIPSTGVAIQTACESYTWINGLTYTSSTNSPTFTLTNSQGCDSIVTLHLTINNSTTSTLTQTFCDSFIFNGKTYTGSGNYVDTITNVAGCDSVIFLNLTGLYSNTGTDHQAACGSYTWIDGNTYTSSNNTATFTLTNAQGCDSLVTLNLNILNSDFNVDNRVACDSLAFHGQWYTNSGFYSDTLTNSQGCDSIVAVDLIIINSSTGVDVQTACDSFTWIDGNTYTSSNTTATFTLPNAAGCDSVVTLNLTINTVDVSTQTVGNSITANATAANYQWLDCDSNKVAIVGATSQSFSPIKDGNYAVIVIQNGCVDTSACVAFTGTAIQQLPTALPLAIYPNPTTGVFAVDLGDFKEAKVQIFAANGQLLQQHNLQGQRVQELELEGAAGVYFVQVQVNNQVYYSKLIKQ